MTGVAFEDVIMGLDFDTKHIGWATVRGHDHTTGHVMFPRDDWGRFLLLVQKWVKDMVRDHRPAVVCIEDVHVGKFASAAGPLYMQRAAALMALAGYVGAIDFATPGEWKRDICGRGNITTKEKKAGKIVEIVNRMGFKVSQIDEADALCIALFERKKLTGRIV